MKHLKLKTIIILCAIVFLALFLRLYHLTTVPPAAYWDETAIGYNAYSILQTGKDEWGVPYPILFRSFDDFKPPVYIYTVAIFEKFLGPTDPAVRLPAAISGTLTVLFVFFLTMELLNIGNSLEIRNSKLEISLIATLLLAVSPWHLQFTRAGFEASLTLLFIVVGVWLFLLAVRKNIRWLFPSLLFFSLATMTYHNARIFLPPFLVVLFIVFRQKLLINIRSVIIILTVILFLNLPYLPTWVSPEGRARLISESILNQPGDLAVNLQQNYLSNFSLDYLFFHGDQNGRHSVKKLGELYLWSLPFVLFGAFFLIKKRNIAGTILLSWLLLGAVPAAITKVSPHALRGFIMVIPLAVIPAIGVVSTLKKLRFLWVPLLAIVLYSLFLYLHIYYIHYPKAYAADWQDGFRSTVQYLSGIEGDYDQIFVHKDLPPAYLLFYQAFPPSVLQMQNHDTRVLGKYYYHDLFTSPVKKDKTKKSLIVAPSWMISKDVEVKREIRMIDGTPVFEIYEF